LDEGVVLVSSRKTTRWLHEAGASDTKRIFYLFTPFGGQFGSFLDHALQWLPLGGQYVASARAGRS
jgi:hypothetical protein